MNVLFVCSENRLRSPTAEEIFSRYAEINARSAGLGAFAETPVSCELIEWADIIFVMEKTQRDMIEREYPALLHDKRLVCLDIPDRYDYLQPELVELLEEKVPPHLHLQ